MSDVSKFNEAGEEIKETPDFGEYQNDDENVKLLAEELTEFNNLYLFNGKYDLYIDRAGHIKVNTFSQKLTLEALKQTERINNKLIQLNEKWRSFIQYIIRRYEVWLGAQELKHTNEIIITFVSQKFI